MRHVSVTDVRPLDRLGSIKIKLGVLVLAVVTFAAFFTWLGLRNNLGPRWTFPLTIILSMVITQVLARGMTSPLREMTAAVRAMADGDYSQRVRASSRDEVGQLAHAFNRMSEDLETQDIVRRELVANVSHELRTPVAALQAQLENLVDGVVKPTPAALNSAFNQTERLGRLVSYLLDLSRLDAGAASLQLIELDLRDFLTDCVIQAELVAPSKGLEFRVDVEPEDLATYADQERLRQVITNLLNNAIRHAPDGSLISVRARATNSHAVIDISDQGAGIAPEDRHRVFQRFQQGNHRSGTDSTGGTGLGLAIVRWAVELHGGKVEVADAVGGATIRIWLPLEPHTET